MHRNRPTLASAPAALAAALLVASGLAGEPVLAQGVTPAPPGGATGPGGRSPVVSAAGVVRGTVVEAESRRPVSGATVHLVAWTDDHEPRAADEAAELVTSTDAAGSYRFDRVPAGRWRIEVTGLGYRGAEVWIDLPESWEVRRSVGLVVEPVMLEPVAVSLSAPRARMLPDLPATPEARVVRPLAATAAGAASAFTLDTRVLDPRDLPGVGALGEPDVFRALQRLPGVSGRGDFSADVWTRAAPWGMTQILMDGLPLYDPLHLGGIAAGMAADGLESVAIMPGVRAASAAEGAAGTIALTTRRAAADGPAGAAAVSSMAVRARAEHRWLHERVGLALSARRSWWDVLQPPAFLTGERSGGSIDYRFADVSGRFDAELGRAGRLELGGLWEEDLLYGDIRDLVSSSRGRWGNRLGWIRLGRDVAGVRAEASVGAVAYDVRTRPLPWYSFLGPDGIPSLDLLETDLDHRAWNLRVESRSGSRLTWASGATGVRERLEQIGLEADDRALPGTGGAERLARQRVWAEAAVALGPLEVSGGAGLHLLRKDVQAPRVTPSLRVRWAAAPWLTLEAARGEAVQFVYPVAPAGVAVGTALATAYQWVIAGPDVPALHARTSSVGAEVDLPYDITARANAWSRRIAGVWMGGVSGVQLDERRFLGAASGRFGHESGGGFEVGLGWTGERATADVGYSLGRSHFSVEGLPSWPSPSERPHALDAHVSAGVAAALRVGADLTVESGWPIVVGPAAGCPENAHTCVDHPEGEEPPAEYRYERAPAYASLDLKVRWERRWERFALGITGSLRNAFGRDNMAAFRSGTCQGSELISPVCESMQGMARFSPGLTRPTPSMALSIRF